MWNKRTQLAGLSAIWILVMLVLVPWLTGVLGAQMGYLSVFALYWFGFCLPFGLWFQKNGAWRRALSLETSGHNWVPWAVGGQVIVIAIASLFLLPPQVPLAAVFAAAVAGLMNGFLEEFFWRGAFLEQSGGQPGFQVLGVALFSLWHVPLALAQGVTYEGGPAALIVGALGLGAFWGYITYRTGRIGWPIIAHMATNALAFIGLIAVNFMPAS